MKEETIKVIRVERIKIFPTDLLWRDKGITLTTEPTEISTAINLRTNH